MAGVKIEHEEPCRGGGLMTSIKTSPSRDWPGSHPLEVRQLTPPLSCSPSVRCHVVRKVGREKLNFSLFESLSLSQQDGSPGKELPHRQSPLGQKELSIDRAEGQANFKEGLWQHS